jgi:bifunctional non-homologous end joining protein LigD
VCRDRSWLALRAVPTILSGGKAVLRKVLRRTRRGGIQYVAHIEGDGEEMFAAVCEHGLEGIVSKKLNGPYRSGRSKSWIKFKNPKAPAATRMTEMESR